MTTKIWCLPLVFAMLATTACAAPGVGATRGPTAKLPKAVKPDEAFKIIRDEFRKLPRPIIAGYDENAHNVRDYIVRLTPAAGDFIRKHGRLAVVVSLYPMLVDKKYSGDAFALLSVADDPLRSIDDFLHPDRYLSPEKPGQWKVHDPGTFEYRFQIDYVKHYTKCFYPDEPPEKEPPAPVKDWSNALVEGDQPPIIAAFDDFINDLYKLKEQRPFIDKYIADKSGKVVDFRLKPEVIKILRKYPPEVAVPVVWAVAHRHYNIYPHGKHRMGPLLAELLGKRKEFAESLSYIGEDAAPFHDKLRAFHYRRLEYLFTIEGLRWITSKSPDVDAVLPPLELPKDLQEPPK